MSATTIQERLAADLAYLIGPRRWYRSADAVALAVAKEGVLLRLMVDRPGPRRR